MPLTTQIEQEPRRASLQRKTKETGISLRLNLDGSGNNEIGTGCGMLDHLLDLLSFWGEMDLEVACQGDLHIDAHHLVEDCGLVLGAAIMQALGDCQGIQRTGFGKVPMDEAMAEATVDLSGRPWLEWRGGELLPPVIAHEEKDVWREFFKAIASSARMNLHISFLYGLNGHHLLESAAKGLGVAMRHAKRKSGLHIVKSTKGVLDR